MVQSCNGSISAEHGVGYFKAPFLKYSKSKEMIDTMKLMKKTLDPHSIMNPHKLFP